MTEQTKNGKDPWREILHGPQHSKFKRILLGSVVIYKSFCKILFIFVNDEKLYRNDFDFCYLYISFHEKFYSSFIFKRSIII